MDEKIQLFSLIISEILVYFKFLLLYLQFKENFILKYSISHFNLNSLIFSQRKLSKNWIVFETRKWWGKLVIEKSFLKSFNWNCFCRRHSQVGDFVATRVRQKYNWIFCWPELNKVTLIPLIGQGRWWDWCCSNLGVCV